VDLDIDKGELDWDNDKLWEWKYDAAFTSQVIYAAPVFIVRVFLILIRHLG